MRLEDLLKKLAQTQGAERAEIQKMALEARLELQMCVRPTQLHWEDRVRRVKIER